jgi:hypothetical protein
MSAATTLIGRFPTLFSDLYTNTHFTIAGSFAQSPGPRAMTLFN